MWLIWPETYHSILLQSPPKNKTAKKTRPDTGQTHGLCDIFWIYILDIWIFGYFGYFGYLDIWIFEYLNIWIFWILGFWENWKKITKVVFALVRYNNKEKEETSPDTGQTHGLLI